MRILQVSSARALGGGERHVADLARGLAARGHELYAALAPGSPLRDELAALPPGNVLTLPLRNALDFASAVRLARLARGRRVDIVHAHVARDYTLAAFAARRSGARLVITRHVLFPLGRAHRFALAEVSRVIAVSGAVARSLAARRIFPPEKIRVVPNAVDVGRFEEAREAFERARPAGGERRPLRVGLVGELSEVKGQDVFLRAAALVAPRFGGAVEFVVVGADTSRDGLRRARLEGLIAELKLGGRVRMSGRWEDTADVLPTFDLFVSASRSEAFGMAMVEAMAAGLPVVATATEGAREIVEHGETGLLVPVGDAPALAEAIASLIADDARRGRFGRRAREAARERFGLERMVAATERVYAEALGLSVEA
ncbi:MAG TPA: glycosyltransferase family 4 protein [Pyrinomonadaceae bacterium]|nr:glycosyltransferase family 4 protein [Pyrinomonadaceae bacterium]